MKSIVKIALCVTLSQSSLIAKGGDSIRARAPMTALVFDARDGVEGPLKKAYFDDEIDFFLDLEAPRHPITRDLSALRNAGRLVESGDFANVEPMLRSVSRFENEKTYIRGTLYGAQGRYEASAEEFRQLIDKRQDISKRLGTLAFLGAARIFHEVGDYDQAIYHYTQVRQIDPLFFQAIFEKSWSFYQSGDMNGALGSTLSFISPYFENTFYPEAFIVRAAAFYQLCYFDRATSTVEFFKTYFEPVRSQISQLLSRGVETWLFSEGALKNINPRIVGGLVADPDFRSNLRAYLSLREEVNRLKGYEVSTAKQAFQFVKSRLANHAKRTLTKMEGQLRDYLAQADIIQIEILQTGANVLMGQDMKQNVPVKTIDLASVDFDEMIQFWPFKKEFWLDELGSYYYGLKAACN